MEALSSPPFVAVEGVFNIRSVGGLPVGGDGKQVKPSLIYRSGALGMITDKGKDQLAALKITTAFDFRLQSEAGDYKLPDPVVTGLAIRKVPITDAEPLDPAAIAIRLQAFAERELDAFRDIYTEILELGGPSFEAILRHIIDKPDEAFLVYCTAGKDRTGVFIALLLMLLGVEDQAIADDYGLSTIGLEPVAPFFTKRFQQIPAYRDNWQGALNLGSSRPQTMIATIELINTKYGGAEKYLKLKTSLGEKDIQKVRSNLIA